MSLKFLRPWVGGCCPLNQLSVCGPRERAWADTKLWFMGSARPCTEEVFFFGVPYNLKAPMLIVHKSYLGKNTEAKFLGVIGTKVCTVFLLDIHSHLY